MKLKQVRFFKNGYYGTLACPSEKLQEKIKVAQKEGYTILDGVTEIDAPLFEDMRPEPIQKYHKIN